MKKVFFVLLIVIGIIVYAVTQTAAEPRTRREVERFEAVVLSNTQIRKLYSRYTRDEYRIYVNIPASFYNDPDNDYPTLYVLDADFSFALTKQIGEYLMDRSRIKEFIIVGVAYDGPLRYMINRTRDYTPTKTIGAHGERNRVHSGGAENFYQFLDKELIPYIKENFPASDDQGIVGHSFGGLFATYVLLNYPETFNKAIIVSPSLWYDDDLLLKQAQEKENFDFHEPHKIFFTIGANENKGRYKMVDDLTKFSNIIQQKPHDNLEYQTYIWNDLDHDTVFPAALTMGLTYLYEY